MNPHNTQEQQLAQTALEAIDRAPVTGLEAQERTIAAARMLHGLAIGQQRLISADEYDEYQQLKAARDHVARDTEA